VLEELQAHVETRPLDVLACVDLLLRRDNPGWTVFGSRARLEAILSRTTRSDDTEVKKRAVAIVHYLGAIGHFEFRKLVGMATTSSIETEPA
jgi:hypothetical protein